MKYNNFTYKILLPLFIGLFLIGSVSIYTNFFLLEKNISKQADETFGFIKTSLKRIVKQETNLMLGLIEQIEKDQKVINLYQSNNRDETYKYLFNTYSSFKNRYDITHLYIHKINKQNFIRIHNKNQHSDVIYRTTLDNASNTLEVSSGIEFGVAHNLTLRVVLPWIVDGKLIGYLELGKEVDKLTPQITDLINIDMIFTIKRDLITEEDFEKWKNKSDRNRHYAMMDSYYIIDSTIDIIGSDLQVHLNKTDIENSHYIQNEKSQYFVHSNPFFDINNKNVGSIHILIDETKDYEFLYNLILKVTIIISILLCSIIVYYFKFLKKIEQKLNEAYEEIELISITDALTTLYNKRHYLHNVPKQIKTCSRCNGYISFILVDVDNFKKYNDNYGHLQGDKVLQQISLSIRNLFQRTSDCCYRVGGEEFLIVSESDNEYNGYKMAQKLCKTIETLNIEHKYNNDLSSLTVSIGVYTKKTDKTTKVEELYNNVDIALYKSKDNGRNQVTNFNNIT